MKDLEIRGAGNLLGGEQSGHIAGRRVRPLRAARRRGGRRASAATATTAPTEIKIELPVDAHLPHDYVPGERLRLEAYKKLASRRRRGASWPRSRPSWSTATARCPSRCATCWRSPGCARWPAPAGVARHRRAGQPRAVRPGRAARVGQQLRLQRLYPKSLVKDAVHTILVPKPMTARVGGQPLRDTAVLQWASDLIRAVLLGSVADARPGRHPTGTARPLTASTEKSRRKGCQ